MVLWKTAGQAVEGSVIIIGTLLFLLSFSRRIAIYGAATLQGEGDVKILGK